MHTLLQCLTLHPPAKSTRRVNKSGESNQGWNVSKDPIIFCHFPKAGGSSIARQLREEFRVACLQDYDHDPLGSQGDETVEHLPPDINGVLGHFRAQRYDALERRFFSHSCASLSTICCRYIFSGSRIRAAATHGTNNSSTKRQISSVSPNMGRYSTSCRKATLAVSI